ncbi:LysM peptidoglycan-binding domain-containing protein [Terricaulis sp.]|uniref:LysM peptidoglycan-binding domain-containing protein n=1 Tax=Terricaulis sp. TaxID=2768686 RepID=UPI0037852E2E
MRHLLQPVLALSLVSALAACASMPSVHDLTHPAPIAESEQPAAAPERTPREHVRVAVGLLDAGEERQARAELRAALDAQPNNSAARRLMDQIETDPRELLRGRTFAYTVRSGETMSELAQRYLGDPLLFYALARFNGLEAPNQLTAGRVLQIPQRAGAAIVALPPQSTTPPSPTQEASMPAPPPAAVQRRAGIDPARAGQLRLQGLQRLNGGDVNGAVSLLRQAQTLDADNPAIQRDLDRALRMQASLQTPSAPQLRTN